MIEQHFKNIILASGLRIKHGEGWREEEKGNKREGYAGESQRQLRPRCWW